jgi:hypothetical protein
MLHRTYQDVRRLIVKHVKEYLPQIKSIEEAENFDLEDLYARVKLSVVTLLLRECHRYTLDNVKLGTKPEIPKVIPGNPGE